MIQNILLAYLLQIATTIGIIVLFGFLIALCNKKFYEIAGTKSKLLCYVTGCIGTPVHELSHAFFCLIFGHKINEIKLFQINSADGTLGYVNHSYNKKNIYQRIGNFFIGIAPIIVISSLLYLLAYLLLPNFVKVIDASFEISDFINDFGNVFISIFVVLQSFFECAFSWQWWVYVVVGIFLALHMNLSKADIKGAMSGLIFTLVAVMIVDVILGIVSLDLLNGFTQIVLSIASYLLCVLILALMISVIALLASFIFKVSKKKINKF
ncbi:MAG: metalloprotease family protein [Candidatus Coproplasma sp.]